MNLPDKILLALLYAIIPAITSCSLTPDPNPDQVKILKAQWVNPYPVGSYAHFTAEPSYPKTYKVYKDATAFGASAAGYVRVSYTVNEADLGEACRRIGQFVESL